MRRIALRYVLVVVIGLVMTRPAGADQIVIRDRPLVQGRVIGMNEQVLKIRDRSGTEQTFDRDRVVAFVIDSASQPATGTSDQLQDMRDQLNKLQTAAEIQYQALRQLSSDLRMARGLEIITHDGFRQGDDYVIEGQVLNHSDEVIHSALVEVLLIYKRGVVRRRTALIEPDELAPGDEGQFRVLFDRKPLFDEYRLIPQVSWRATVGQRN